MKIKPKQSAIKEWLFYLPFTQQALLIMATRGADNMPKNNFGKDLIHYMRGLILHPAYFGYDGTPEGYMRGDYDNFNKIVDSFFNDLDAYPMHFLMHLIHAGEVVGYKHPNKIIKDNWLEFYKKACDNFHMNIETEEQLDNRLSK